MTALTPSRGHVATPHDRPRLRILLSYHYYRNVDLDELIGDNFVEPYPEVFADSGAFSAMTQGAKILLPEYIAWIERWRHWFTVYSNLDVIRYPDATWDNQRRMEDAGLAPLPVFHVATSYDWLEHYLDRYGYLALGVAGLSWKVYMGWVVRCFRMAQGRAVYHGFGITSWTPLLALPWYSVDSSSWQQGFRYGAVPVFDDAAGKFHRLRLGTDEWFRHAGLVRDYGFDPGDFAHRDRNDYRLMAQIAALSYLRAERWLRRRHGHIQMPQPANVDGPSTLPGRVRLFAEPTSDAVEPDHGLRVYLAGSESSQRHLTTIQDHAAAREEYE